MPSPTDDKLSGASCYNLTLVKLLSLILFLLCYIRMPQTASVADVWQPKVGSQHWSVKLLINTISSSEMRDNDSTHLFRHPEDLMNAAMPQSKGN